MTSRTPTTRATKRSRPKYGRRPNNLVWSMMKRSRTGPIGSVKQLTATLRELQDGWSSSGISSTTSNRRRPTQSAIMKDRIPVDLDAELSLDNVLTDIRFRGELGYKL